MASPPSYRPSQTSPPYLPHIPLPNNPKKRPSLNVNSAGPSKRRKPSSLTAGSSTPSSSHPLRQTSFPPEESILDARSPSVESDVTGITGGGRSVITTGTMRGKKGKGKRRKGEGSVRSGVGKGVDGNGAVGGDEVLEEEEEDGDGDEGVQDHGEKMDRAAERKNLAILVDAFSADQNDRYDFFRRVKLKKETVRKIANQTLSQSVPPSVITTISGYTKTFIGTLIERAREVQAQWESLPSPQPDTHHLTPSPSPSLHLPSVSPPPPDPAESDPFAQMTRFIHIPQTQPQPQETEKEMEDLGPLLPDHFREALRRYKRDGEGGGTGVAGMSLGLGVVGVRVARRGGSRLFG